MSKSQFRCPTCKGAFQCNASSKAIRVKCPHCATQVTVPAVPGEPTWYVAQGKQKSGPFTLEQLHRLVAEGQLSPADMTLKDGDRKWSAASSVPGLCLEPQAHSVTGSGPGLSGPTVTYHCVVCQSELRSRVVDAGQEVVCPFCTQRMVVPSPESAPSTSMQQDTPDPGWGLYTRVQQAFFTPVNALQQEAARMTSLPDPLAPWEPDRIRCVCSAAISAVTALELDGSLPTAARQALLHLEQHRTRLLCSLDPAAWELRAALQQVRGLKLPIGWLDGVLNEAARAKDDPLSQTGRVAIGGALVGTYFLPVIGTAIGFTLGALLAHAASREQQQGAEHTTLTRFIQAGNAMTEAVQDLFGQVWDCIAQGMRTAGDSEVREAAFFAAAQQRWQELAARLGQHMTPENGAWAWDEVTSFQTQWGPHPGAVDTAARLSLPPFARDLDNAAAWADMQIQMYPSLPEGYENRAEVCLELADPQNCLAWVDAGLGIDPGHERLRLLQIEALTILGRLDEARVLVDARCSAEKGGDAWVRYLRGLHRSGRPVEAAWAAHHWALVYKTFHGIAYCVRLDPLMGTDLTFLTHIPEFAQLMQAPDWELQGVIERRLDSDDVRSFRGNLPAERLAQLRATFPGLAPGERVLYFLDASRWYGTGGLLVTTARVFWKTPRQEPVAVALAGLTQEQVGTEGSVLKLAGQTVDVKDPALAATLAAALVELADAVRRVMAASDCPAVG